MFGIASKKSYGIDIGTQTIKIVELSSNAKNISVMNYSIWNDEINNIIQDKSGNSSLSVDSIINIINVMLDSAEMNIAEAYVAVPSYLAFSAVISMPIMGPEELASAVPLEAKQHIPVPLNTVQLDWMNLGENKEKDRYNILLIAIPTTAVKKYMDVSGALGVKIKGFELDVFSVIRAIELPSSQVCLVDIGARTTTVSIVNSDKQLQAIQSFDFGGNQITKLIAEMKGISAADAELLKKSNGIGGVESQVSNLIQSKFKSFIENEVIRVIKQTQDKMQIKVEDVVLLGGVVKMNGLKDFVDMVIKSNLVGQDIKTSVANPIHDLSIKGVKDKSQADKIYQDLLLSIGIALKDYIK
ncbi:MAG: hypothetical protein RLZZ223_418 [Candidatus Parcubacteria bacterium]|jgi:type IV pilus assembly protein PilM